LWVLPMTGENRKPQPYLKSGFDQSQGCFSPDGRYVAYRSNSSGLPEIYVQPFPDANGGKWLISKGGGSEPVWRDDGRELYFISSDGKLMAVDVNTVPEFKTGMPRVLFNLDTTQFDSLTTQSFFGYAVSIDGKKVLVRSRLPDAAVQVPRPVTVVLNWTSLLNR